ncbi:MAG: CPBP family intramembrane glutamic endopeptidase, partial [Verrucomicrobiota bacterium]
MKRDPQHILFGLEEDQYSLKALAMICWLYVGTLVFAALLSPWFFRLVNDSDALLSILSEDTLAYLREKPITRFFDRIRILGVLIVLPLLFKYAKLYSFSKIGFRRTFKEFFKWYAYGLGMMAIVLAVTVFSQSIEPRTDWSIGRQIEKSLGAIVGATTLSIVEEVIFRGLIFRLFYTLLKPIPAIILSSLFFASLHFKMNPERIAHLGPEEIGLQEGFFVAWGYVTAVADGFNLLSFINYSLVGILLHQAFLKTGNLWSSIGLHAGWVTIMLSLNKTFQAGPNANAFTGTHRVIDGLWVTIVMTAFVIAFAL